MKASVLILEKADGALKAITGKASELLAQVPSIREAGRHDGEDIKGGLIMSTHAIGPYSTFKCKAPAKPSKKKG